MLTAAVLGIATGTAIGFLLCTFAFFAARRHVSHAMAAGASVAYRPPDWRGFAKNAAFLLLILVALHWLPDVLAWGYASFQGETLVISERRWRGILFVGYAMASTGVSANLIGLLWATRQGSRRTKVG
ncbi:hypothetical protein [Variovorax boronicumulans]|uniref:hypothetical protein n=1 Tax=Variovorax boronicumulans TaxID=436515 RepID=UPI00339578C8